MGWLEKKGRILVDFGGGCYAVQREGGGRRNNLNSDGKTTLKRMISDTTMGGKKGAVSFGAVKKTTPPVGQKKLLRGMPIEGASWSRGKGPSQVSTDWMCQNFFPGTIEDWGTYLNRKWLGDEGVRKESCFGKKEGQGKKRYQKKGVGSEVKKRGGLARWTRRQKLEKVFSGKKVKKDSSNTGKGHTFGGAGYEGEER